MSYRTRRSRLVYENRWMRLREDEIERPDGSRGIYGVVEKADFVVVIALQDDEVTLVSQFRYPIGRQSLEFPQGALEQAPETPPELVARAELHEAQLRESALLDTAEHAAVETERALQLGDAQHHVVDQSDPDGGHLSLTTNSSL